MLLLFLRAVLRIVGRVCWGLLYPGGRVLVVRRGLWMVVGGFVIVVDIGLFAAVVVVGREERKGC